MPLDRGTMMGPYEILEFIGAGGMGEVYGGRDTRLGRRVAIKVLKAEYSSRKDARKNFLREATTISHLSHAHICSLFDVGNQDGTDYLVMEYLDGETLARRLLLGPFSIEKAVHYGIEIADALDHAHGVGVYHRDLKPGNMIITNTGPLKLLDFGLATWNENSGTAGNPMDNTLTAPGIIFGTLPYMSPEQIEGQGTSACTDVFALGVILYEMINGHRPFNGSTPASLAGSILSTEPKITPEMEKNPGLTRLIQKCLAKSPQDRWQNVRDVKHELQWIAEDLKTGRIGKRESDAIRPIRHWTTKRWVISATIAGILIALFAFFGNQPGLLHRQPSATNTTKTLAVLPLKNLSVDSSQVYLADAMTEELITNIAQVDSLRVISRTSVMGYKDTHKSLPQIGRELNADYILEGSILMIGNQMRISAQLIDAHSDQHVWAESYDRSLGDILKLFNDVASSISSEIQLQLTPESKTRLAKAKPVNPDAYQAYLRGKYLLFPPDLTSENPPLAIQMLERSVQLDPSFALAFSTLSRAYSVNYQLVDHNPEFLVKAKAAADRAFQLQPDMGEAHAALGYYYYAGYRDFDRAIQEYSVASKKLPGNTTVLALMAAVYRRTGNFEAAEIVLKEAFDYSPREARAAWEAGSVLTIRRKYAEADRYFRNAISLAPDQSSGYSGKAKNHLLWNGNVEQARLTLMEMPPTKDPDSNFTRFLVEMARRDYEGALNIVTTHIVEPKRRAFHDFLIGFIRTRSVQPKEARHSYQNALSTLQQSVTSRREDPAYHSLLGCVYAGLGEKEAAIREGKLAVSMIPVSKDALFGPDFVETLAFIYTLTGDSDQAVETLKYLLSIPSRNMSVAMLKIDPRWDPLRNHPGFKKLVE